ncbi:hypothetical protein C4D60_Mb03t19100 [Musa balbisiana]|uniref:Uncharacterized protein n=1 Tax=Musa balbisiana TaxID=52838 RepID=A0A4S8JAX1_MUSBA|nr:hypothetical protein C4D60_Mb03t19100 [Musa balbisiana]
MRTSPGRDRPPCAGALLCHKVPPSPETVEVQPPPHSRTVTDVLKYSLNRVMTPPSTAQAWTQ